MIAPPWQEELESRSLENSEAQGLSFYGGEIVHRATFMKEKGAYHGSSLPLAINRSENWTYIVLVQSRSLEMSILSPS